MSSIVSTPFATICQILILLFGIFDRIKVIIKSITEMVITSIQKILIRPDSGHVIVVVRRAENLMSSKNPYKLAFMTSFSQRLAQDFVSLHNFKFVRARSFCIKRP